MYIIFKKCNLSDLNDLSRVGTNTMDLLLAIPVTITIGLLSGVGTNTMDLLWAIPVTITIGLLSGVGTNTMDLLWAIPVTVTIGLLMLCIMKRWDGYLWR